MNIFLLFFGSLTINLGIVGFLIYSGVDGWGWLLTVICLIYGSTSVKTKDKDKS